MRTAHLLMGVAVALFAACLAQAASLVPTGCRSSEALQSATSADQQWMLTSESDKASLVLYDKAHQPLRQFALSSTDGKLHGTVLTVVDAAPRSSFIVVLSGIAEIWEISYNPNAEPIFDGLVHDYRMGEGLARPGFLGIRRTLLHTPLTEPHFTTNYSTVIGIEKHIDTSGVQARVVNLDVRREIATGAPAEPTELLRRYCAP